LYSRKYTSLPPLFEPNEVKGVPTFSLKERDAAQRKSLLEKLAPQNTQAMVQVQLCNHTWLT
jgi:hypothetical protein